MGDRAGGRVGKAENAGGGGGGTRGYGSGSGAGEGTGGKGIGVGLGTKMGRVVRGGGVHGGGAEGGCEGRSEGCWKTEPGCQCCLEAKEEQEVLTTGCGWKPVFWGKLEKKVWGLTNVDDDGP